MPCNLQVMESMLQIPNISNKLDNLRHQMKGFAEQLKSHSNTPEKKKHKKKKHRKENPEEVSCGNETQEAAQMEIDDLDKFINAVVDRDMKVQALNPNTQNLGVKKV